VGFYSFVYTTTGQLFVIFSNGIESVQF